MHGGADRAELTGLEALLFDLDGTLVDSMALHFEAYRMAFDARDEPLTRRRFDGAVGGRYTEAIPSMTDARLAPSDVEAIHDAKLRHYAALLEQRPIPLLPAARLLALRGTLRLGLVTSGARDGVALVLERTGWSEVFDVVVTSDDVTAGKPDPEPYTLAITSLGISPAVCLAFEDSDAGLASAAAASLDVVDVRTVDAA